MRTKNSIKNIIMNLVYNFLNYGLRFVSRIVFVKTLAKIYLGVNGLLSNVLGILALTELGIGTAIGYSLYEPLAKGNKEKIRSLMNFYKKAYQIIALVVLILGIILLPFLPYIIKEGTASIKNLNIIYMIYLINMVIGYLFSYKRTLITSDQKKYKIMPITMLFSIITATVQIIILLLFKNYIIYLLVQSICILLENIIVNRYIDKQYEFLASKEPPIPIEKNELTKIKEKIKSLILHKIGSYTLTSTDNLIISKLIGIITVGLYSNYSLIINMIASLIYVLTSNVISSLGNLIAVENSKKSLHVFNEMNLICFILYGISSICLINLFNPFIELVFGKSYLIAISIVYVIVANHYLTGMNNVVISMQTAAGLYEKDKYIPLIQSAVNLTISIYLGIKLGLIGIFIGTIISTLLPLVIKPYIVYKYVFKEKLSIYFKEFFTQLLIVIISIFGSYLIIKYINIENIYFDIAIRLLVSILLPAILIYITYKNSKSFKDLANRTKEVTKNIFANKKINSNM